VQAFAVVGIAILAQVSIPLRPVPVTGQTLGILVAAALLGFRRGSLAAALYLFAGSLGAPLFAKFSGGMHVLLGPTGGYLIGFVLAAGTAGLLAEHGFVRTFPRAVMTMTLATIPVFIVGVAWLSSYYPGQALELGLYPFLPGAFLKIALAALISVRSGRQAA